MSDPTSVRVRMYNVGFGDCFLVSFVYGDVQPAALAGQDTRAERHILVDFGSSSAPRNRLSAARVADLIAADSNGRLDAVVITHRHRDHLSAFGSAKPAAKIAKLRPSLIVRSWTEDPKRAANSGQPGSPVQPTIGALAAAGGSVDEAFRAVLSGSQALAQRISDRAAAAGRGRQTDLVEAAEDQVANAKAVAELDRLAAAGTGEYLSVGKKPKVGRAASRLADVLPGVTVTLLGPPRPSTWPDVERQAEDSDEYWLGADRMVRRLFATRETHRTVALGTERWIIQAMQQDEQRQLASLVRWLDDALNNTSLILLLEVGGHTLLFGGDAQIENWSWALSKATKDPALHGALARVDLYKVGHHGSRNATPKSLYDMWSSRGVGSPLLSMMSTKRGVHGSGEHAVPRIPLVNSLASLGSIHSTDADDIDWIEARATLPGGEWTVTRGSS